MEFIGPEIDDNGGNIKKAIESVGDYVSDVIWNEILEAAGMSEWKLSDTSLIFNITQCQIS